MLQFMEWCQLLHVTNSTNLETSSQAQMGVSLHASWLTRPIQDSSQGDRK